MNFKCTEVTSSQNDVLFKIFRCYFKLWFRWSVRETLTNSKHVQFVSNVNSKDSFFSIFLSSQWHVVSRQVSQKNIPIVLCLMLTVSRVQRLVLLIRAYVFMWLLTWIKVLILLYCRRCTFLIVCVIQNWLSSRTRTKVWKAVAS